MKIQRNANAYVIFYVVAAVCTNFKKKKIFQRHLDELQTKTISIIVGPDDEILYFFLFFCCKS